MNQIGKHSFLLLLLLLCSCLSDDYSDCPSGYTRVRVMFDWSIVPQTYAVAAEDVKSVDVYIFDSNGLLVSWINESEPDLDGTDYYIETVLPYGSYEVVSWLNVGDFYIADPVEPSTFSEARIKLRNESGIIEDELTPLYYGSEKNITLTAESAAEDSFLSVSITPIQNTNALNFSITGGEPGEEYELSVIDDNGIYNFDNMIVPGEELHYITSLSGDSEELMGRLVVGKLGRERSPGVRVTNIHNHEVVYEASLTALLLREETEDNPIDIENTHAYEIALDITRGPEEPVVLQIGFSWEEVDESGQQGIKPEEAVTVDLFIFDSEGLFVKHIPKENISLNNAYRIETELEAGEYSMVSWFNLGANYDISPVISGFIEGVTTLQEAGVMLRVSEGIAGVSQGKPLLYGSVSGKEINNLFAGSDGSQHVILPLTQNTYELAFTLTGDIRESSYLLELYDHHGRYDFSNSFAVSRDEIVYRTIVPRSSRGTYTGNLTVERLERGRQPRFIVKNPLGDVLYEISLVDLIVKHELSGNLIDFGRMYRFDLELKFSDKGDGSFNVEVTINGWKVKEEENELG